MLKYIFSFSCLISVASFSFAQLPTTNVFMFSFLNQGTSFKIVDGTFLTNFNDEGYNNQPSFLSDNTVLLTSDHYDKSQTDIIKLDINKKTMKRLTKTSESEYSPTYNKKLQMMSTVRVESNGDQMLHMYKTNGYNQGYKMLEDVKNIGYHLWDNVGNLYLFLIQDGIHRLSLANPNDGTLIPIIENIGRTLKIGSDGNLYFVHKVSEESWYIKSYNPITKKIDIVVRTLKGKEDFELIRGAVISGSGGFLYQHALGDSDDWKKMVDMTEYGLNNISRINIKNNKILIVDKSR